MTDFSNVTHLLFDHDGVLVDSEYWYFKATQDELAAMDIHLHNLQAVLLCLL